MKELSAALGSSMLQSTIDTPLNLAQLSTISESGDIFPTPSTQDESYLGWVNGGNLKGIKVEIVFDFLCPGCLIHLSQIPTCDGTGHFLNIFEYLQGMQVEGEAMTYLDAIDLRLTPFPLAHPHVTELTQVFFFLKHLCSEDASQCHMNDYMLFCFEYQSMVWDK